LKSQETSITEGVSTIVNVGTKMGLSFRQTDTLVVDLAVPGFRCGNMPFAILGLASYERFLAVGATYAIQTEAIPAATAIVFGLE
jgi:hypothetical protein